MKSDFTYDEYRGLLRALADAGYKFAPFQEDLKGRVLYLRHDIDVSLEKATAMAKLEAELDIQATYFFMLQSPLYNLFSQEGIETVELIRELGHGIGVHVIHDDHFITAGAAARAFSAFFLDEWPVMSVHKPDDDSYAGWIANSYLNTYGPEFFARDRYSSDSGGTWRFGYPLAREWFLKRRRAQLLIHPIWWDTKPTTHMERLQNMKKLVEQHNKEALLKEYMILTQHIDDLK